MPVVVSNTTPLHYLILIGRDSILKELYGEVFVPPAVLAELQHAAAPSAVSVWAANPPAWVTVAAPESIAPESEGLDLGERQALALAREMRADLVLLDDKVARKYAQRARLAVKGTLGIVAAAARAGWVDFTETVEMLQRTSMHMDRDLVAEVIAEYGRTVRREEDSGREP